MLFTQKTIKLYGLPRSGTNLYEFMLRHNFNVKCLTLKYGWKHAEIKGMVPNPTVIVKNPYAWFVSLFHYATKDNLKRIKRFHLPENITFREFLKRPYVWDSPDSIGPKSIKVFQKSDTPIHHWNNMNRSWFENCMLAITYEDLMFDTENTLDIISKKFHINRTSSEIVWPLKELHPGDGLEKNNAPASRNQSYSKVQYYKDQQYFKWYDREMIDYINELLDRELMNKFRYNFFSL